jgi:hypothetical protein
MLREPALLEESETDPPVLPSEAQMRLQRAQEAFETFQENVLLARAGDATDPDVAASVEKVRAKLLADLKTCRDELNQLTTEKLTAHRQRVEREEFTKMLRFLLSGKSAPSGRRGSG